MARGWLYLSVMIFLLAACGGGNRPATPVTLETEVSVLAAPTVSVLPTPTPFVFPQDMTSVTVAPGRAVAIGRLLSLDHQPLSDTVVRLAEVYYADENSKDSSTGAYALDNAFSPSAITNDNGFFIFQDIEPRDYVVFVGDFMTNYTIEVDDQGYPRMRTVAADQINDFGAVVVDFP